MKTRKLLSGLIEQKTIREYLLLIDFGIAHDYEIIACQDLFRVWRVDRDGNKHFDGVYERSEAINIDTNVHHFKKGMTTTTKSVSLSEYTRYAKPNPDFDSNVSFIKNTLRSAVEYLVSQQEEESKTPTINETYESLMNYAFDEGIIPINSKAELWVYFSPKWYQFLELKSNPIATRELFSEFIKDYNQSTGIFRPARTPSLKPSIKKQAIAKIRAIINKIKFIAGLSEIKNYWLNKLIDLLFFLIGTFLLALVGYGLYKFTGHRTPWI